MGHQGRHFQLGSHQRSTRHSHLLLRGLLPSSLGPIKVKVLLSSIITLTKVVAKFAFTKVGALYWHKYNSGCKEATGTITQIKVWM